MNAQPVPIESFRTTNAIRSLMENRFIRITLKLLLGMAAVAAAAVAAVAAAAIYNAFDEDLSPQAKALLDPAPMGKIEDSNGFVAFLGMVAPEGQDQMDWGRKAAAAFAAQAQPGFARTPEWKEATGVHLKVNAAVWCKPSCLVEARRDAASVSGRLANSANAQLLERYRKVRAAPEFADLYVGGLTTQPPGSYSALAAAGALSLSDAVLKSSAGDAAPMVAELEREVAFHRRLIAQGRTLATVLNGENLLARDLLAVSELVRSEGKAIAPYLARLGELTRQPISAAGTQAAFRFHGHEMVSWAQHWKQLLRDNGGLPQREYNFLPVENWSMSFFIQPNATANVVAAIMTAEASLATVPATQFDSQRTALRGVNDALLQGPWYAEGSNPVGKGVAEISTTQLGKYVARMHDVQALQRMVDLQLSLAARGISEPAAIVAFISGDGAKADVDPYTGRPFAFDPDKRLLSYEPRAESRWNSELKKHYGGRVAVAL